jgi:hypothetical protein
MLKRSISVLTCSLILTYSSVTAQTKAELLAVHRGTGAAAEGTRDYFDRKQSVLDVGNLTLRFSNAAILGFDRWGLNHEFPAGSMLTSGCCTYYWTMGPIIGGLINGQPSVAVGVRGTLRDHEEEFEPLFGYDADTVNIPENIGIAFSDKPASWPPQWPIESDPSGTYTDPWTGLSFPALEAPLDIHQPGGVGLRFPGADGGIVNARREAYFVATDNDPEEGNNYASNGVGPLNIRVDLWALQYDDIQVTDFLVFKQQFTNVGADTLYDVYAGVAGDPDAPEQGGQEWTDDLALFIERNDPHLAEKLVDTTQSWLLWNLALVWDMDDYTAAFPDANVGWIGFKLLDCTKYSNDGSTESRDITTFYTFPYNQDAESDAEAYSEQLLAGIQTPHNITPYPADVFQKPYSYGPDITWVIASGPFTLAPGEQITFTFADILGEDELDLLNNARAAQLLYEAGFQNPAVATVIDSTTWNNIEEVGPLEMVFRIAANAGWALSNDSVWLHYGLNGSFIDSLELTRDLAADTNRYSGWVPEFSDVTGTTELSYYLTLRAADGTPYAWPSGAPANYRTRIFGPDTTGPVIGEITAVENVHYLLPFHRRVLVRDITDDRFATAPPQLHWRIGDGPEQTVPMEEDSVQIEWYWIPAWSGTISGLAQTMGDTVRYWVSAADSSQNQNIGTSAVQWFVAEDRVVIGNWENEDLDGDWYFGDGWDYVDFYWDTLQWGRVAVLHLSGATGDTGILQLTAPLDLTRFDSVWCKIPMTFSTHQVENYRLVEISTDNLAWEVIDTVRWGGAPLVPVVENYSLGDYTGFDSVYLRLRAERNAGGLLDWLVDDIILHSDSTLLTVEGSDLLPQRVVLHQNYPNPFNPVTTLRYELPEYTHVRLVIYDLLGREVAVLVDRQQEPGVKTVTWDASQVASGIYFYRLAAGDRSFTRKLVVLK